MAQTEKRLELLRRNAEALEALVGNLTTQRWAIQQETIKGLSRLLKEYDQWCGIVAKTQEQLADCGEERGGSEEALLQIEMEQKKLRVLQAGNLLLETANREKASASGQLKSRSVNRQVRAQYVTSWAVLTRGRLINEKR